MYLHILTLIYQLRKAYTYFVQGLRGDMFALPYMSHGSFKSAYCISFKTC